MSVRIRDEDRGFRRIVRTMIQADGSEVSVGVQEPQAGTDRGGITNAGVAAIHEFGAPSKNIPERSFIRSTVDENRNRYARLFDRVGRDAATGRQALGALFVAGEQVRADIVRKIQSGIPPPVKRGGTPLIDTGLLLSSITTKVTGR